MEAVRAVETDYLVVGAGAAGLAFADALLTHSDADVVLVDRRARPGGHWNDAYGFVRLHLPSAYYGVDSLVLGSDAIDDSGPNAGLYERATGTEVRDYFWRVLDERLLPSGRVRFLGESDYVGGTDGAHRVVGRRTGETNDVRVRRKLVDARYLEAEVPATHTPAFDVVPMARVVPVNALADLSQPADRYVVLGAGKTGIDACLWLLDNGVGVDRIQWVKPQEPWLLDRAGWQPLDLVGSLMEGLSVEVEALAVATSVDDLFLRLEACGRLLRVDAGVTPTAYRGGSVSRAELAQLRQIDDVVRLGHVRRVEAGRLVLNDGVVRTGAETLHVDCTAAGLRLVAPRPAFEGDRVTVQQVRSAQPCFNGALLGYVEATRTDVEAQNRLCPPNPLPHTTVDWLSGFGVTQVAARAWRKEPDVSDWVERSRLNLLRGVPARAHEPQVQQALTRYVSNLKQAMTRLPELVAAG